MSDTMNDNAAAAAADADAFEDEDECRVCRGPAEEGHPLYKPCKCSGSIGLTHQDCLQQWLAVGQRGGENHRGRCELCKTKFQFAPQYAENAPDTLPAHQVWIGLLRRILAQWIPFSIRVLFAASLWLVAAPLATAYLYHGWMHKPYAILERFQWKLVSGDLVAGAVVAACIIISFLSLMSFADFLRVEFQHGGGGGGAAHAGGGGGAMPPPLEPRQHRRPLHARAAGGGAAAGGADAPPPDRNQPPPVIADEDVDDGIWNHVQQQILTHPPRGLAAAAAAAGQEDGAAVNNRDDQDVSSDDEAGAQAFADLHSGDDDHDDDEEEDASVSDWSVADDDDDEEDLMDDLEDDDDDDDDDEAERALLQEELLDELGDLRRQNEVRNALEGVQRRNRNARIQQPLMAQNQAQRAANAAGAGAPFDGLDPEDQIEMDINIALDELLGVRGPLNAVIRNLLWLLVFNAVYLGLFAFTPKILGTALSSVLFNATAFGFDAQGHDMHSSNTTELEDSNTTNTNTTTAFAATSITDYSLSGIIHAVEQESARLNTTFRVKDIATIVIGYLSCAITMVLLRYLWILSKTIRVIRHARRLRTGNNNNNNNNNHAADIDDINDAIGEFVHGMRAGPRGGGDDVHDRHHHLHGGDEHQGIAIAYAVGVALDAVMAIVKVGILLFLKMFLLPVVLGICLDASTISLFNSSLQERVLHAGSDLFSFLLLHWVAGITFMLLVTVSVLQLREVAHPDLLGQMIRPQEPQPDLLGNLMHESVSTHTKRMILSLIIYAVLLMVQVHVPVRMAIASGATKSLGFLNLKFCYMLMPQLQLPLELLIFHLCMLGLLEKYKNSIGEMQHHWLKLQCRWMNMTDCILPQQVETFRLIGSRRVFSANDERRVDEFWYNVSKGERDSIRESLIDAELDSFQKPARPSFTAGDTKPNGHRVLRFGSDFIRLPIRLPGRALRSRSVLMPTTIGRFRLKRDLFRNTDPVIQLWEEVPGSIIPRPPEGWDDLGVGGADVQGRWAWGAERKSTIEESIARRSFFFAPGQGLVRSVLSIAKLCSLLAFSWLATTLFLCFALASPLAIGRCLYYILRIPDQWIHDPLGFAAGCLVFFPLLRAVAGAVVASETNVLYRIAVWAGSFRPPPTRKMIILLVTMALWYGLAPLLLGCIYDVAFIKPLSWFMGDDPIVDAETLVLTWATGLIFLYVWGNLCISGFMSLRFWNFFFEERPAARAEAAGDGEGAQAQAAAEAPQEADPVNDADEQAAAWINAGGNRLRLKWQGKHGRIARFSDTLKSIFVGWEWDKVDATVLLHDSVVPVTAALFWTLFFPAVCLGVCFWRFHALSGFTRAALVRSVLFQTCVFEACQVWQDQLLAWFAAAHRSVRNDRYLIGRVLLNYDEHSPTTGTSS